MNATVNTSSRRMTLSGYNHLMESRREREAREKDIQIAIKERTMEEMLNASQSNITALCKDITSSYNAMLNDGKVMRQCQDELDEKMQEEELFHKTADERYSYKEIDESKVREMTLRRVAYYTLPILDCSFAFFALYPIITSKFVDISSVSPIVAISVGMVLSLFVGFGLSLISRFGVTSIAGEDKPSLLTGIRKAGVMGAVLALPLMYILGEVAFNGGTRWTYSGCFAFISLIIQILIVTGFSRHMEAFKYFKEKHQADSAKSIRKSDEDALNLELSSIQGEIQNTISSFEQHYASFTEQFQRLAAARDEHFRQFGKDANYYLNQMITYFGDLVCFRYEPIPLKYEQNGMISSVPFVEFPYVLGVRNIFLNEDYITLDYMMKYAPSSISISETLRILNEQRQKELSSSSNPSETTIVNDEDGMTNFQPEVDDDGPMWE